MLCVPVDVSDWQRVPVYINCRDRVRDLRCLVAWLENAGYENIVLLDNASTYPELLEFYDKSPHRVMRLGANLGSRSLWQSGLQLNDWFVYTDPDVVPTEDCPDDVIEHLHGLLERHPQYPKAGLGLYLDDVPEAMVSLPWERSLVAPNMRIEPGAFAGDCMVDTTFALHRPGTPHTLRGIRCGWPYQARHSSWYVTEPDEEDRYYLAHAKQGPLGSSWAQGHQRIAA